MHFDKAFDVTGIPVWVVAKALHQASRKRKLSAGSLDITIPATLMMILSEKSGMSDKDYQEICEDRSGNPFIPDYIAGCPIKVTTELYDAEKRRVIANHKYVCIGRLDLYDRDNGGAGTAESILQRLRNNFLLRQQGYL
jgi:hypothetical protein